MVLLRKRSIMFHHWKQLLTDLNRNSSEWQGLRLGKYKTCVLDEIRHNWQNRWTHWLWEFSSDTNRSVLRLWPSQTSFRKLTDALQRPNSFTRSCQDLSVSSRSQPSRLFHCVSLWFVSAYSTLPDCKYPKCLGSFQNDFWTFFREDLLWGMISQLPCILRWKRR